MEVAEGQHRVVMFGTRLENIMGELGELVSHALLPDRRVQVAAARKYAAVRSHARLACIAIWMTYGDG